MLLCQQTNSVAYKETFTFLGNCHVNISLDHVNKKHKTAFSQCAKDFFLDTRQKNGERAYQKNIMKLKSGPYKGQLDYRLLHDKAFTVATHQSQVLQEFQTIPYKNVKKSVQESAERYCAAVYSPLHYHQNSHDIPEYKCLTEYDRLLLAALNLRCMFTLLKNDVSLPLQQKVFPCVQADESVISDLKKHEKNLLSFAYQIHSFAEHVGETFGIVIPDKQKRNFESKMI